MNLTFTVLISIVHATSVAIRFITVPHHNYHCGFIIILLFLTFMKNTVHQELKSRNYVSEHEKTQED